MEEKCEEKGFSVLIKSEAGMNSSDLGDGNKSQGFTLHCCSVLLHQ